MFSMKQVFVVFGIFFVSCANAINGFNGTDIKVALEEAITEIPDLFGHLVKFAESQKDGEIGDDQNNCLAALIAIGEGIAQKKDWALQFADAQFKPPAGILQGRLHFLGAFDECLAIDAVTSSQGAKCDNTSCHLKGQYCSFTQADATAQIGGLRADLCLPTYCTTEVINTFLTHMKDRFNISLALASCTSNDPKPLDSRQVFVSCLMSFIVLCMITGLAIDLYQRVSRNSLSHWACRAFLSFSPYTNTLKIFHTQKESGGLHCLHGIRFLSMCWVITGHTYAMQNIINIANLTDILATMSSIPFQVIMNGTLSVDTFFFVGGLLVAYVTFMQLNKTKGKMNWLLFYFHRIWRLTPAYGLIMSLIFLWPIIGSGPQWNETTEQYIKPCKERWYTMLLYVNNLIKTDPMCMGHGWYLSNDMQFYLVSPILLMLLYKLGKWGHLSNVFVIIVSCITTWSIMYVKQYPSPSFAAQGLNMKTNDYFKDVYMAPWCRIAPYCLGLCVGHLIVNHYEKIRDEYLADLRTLIGGWVIAVALGLLSIFGARPWNRTDLPLDSTNFEHASTAFFAATFRLGWSMAVAWVVIVCVHGYGGIVNRFLSWSPFAPLGRLTYTAYLVHPLILYTNIGLQRTAYYFSHYFTYMTFFSVLVLSYSVALICALAFEAPFIGLEKILLGNLRQPEKRKEPVQSTSTSPA